MTREPVPVDPDAALRAAHRDPRLLALVFVGGTVGTALRAALGLALPGVGTTVAVDLIGALLLGLLLGALGRRGPDAGVRRAIRVALGTGALGGFTTYSAMATDSAGLLLHGAAAAGTGMLAVTVLGGACSAAVGLIAGGRLL